MSIPIQATRRPLATVPSQVPVDALGGQFGEQVMSSMFGRYYNLCRAGLVWKSSFQGALSNNSGAAVTFCFWNPEESGVLMVPIRYMLGYVSGTGVAGTFTWSGMANAGSHIGTAHPLTAFTTHTEDGVGTEFARNQFFGGSANSFNDAGGKGGLGSRSHIRVGDAATLGGSSYTVRTMAISQQAVVVTGTQVFGPLFEDFDGTFIIAPGGFIYPTESGAASGDVWVQQLIWAEIPL